MQCTLYNQQKDLAICTSQAKKMIVHLLEHLRIHTDEVIVHFVTKRRICALHDSLFADPTPTDCISVPIDPVNDPTTPYHVLGEIFVCPKTALEFCEKKKLDPYAETTLYIVHGLLHLIGYDDIDPLERKKMRRKEKKCLSLVSSFSLQKRLSKNILAKSGCV